MFSDGKQVGRMTDAVWSPGLEKNIGYAWVPIDLATPGTRLDVVNEDGDELAAHHRQPPLRRPAEEGAGQEPQRLSSSRTCSITRSG